VFAVFFLQLGGGEEELELFGLGGRVPHRGEDSRALNVVHERVHELDIGSPGLAEQDERVRGTLPRGVGVYVLQCIVCLWALHPAIASPDGIESILRFYSRLKKPRIILGGRAVLDRATVHLTNSNIFKLKIS
jgi:hypothetical protein